MTGCTPLPHHPAVAAVVVGVTGVVVVVGCVSVAVGVAVVLVVATCRMINLVVSFSGQRAKGGFSGSFLCFSGEVSGWLGGTSVGGVGRKYCSESGFVGLGRVLERGLGRLGVGSFVLGAVEDT